ncbi:MAG TPA: cadmium-translocating P-type ATPase [Candidatus Eubacterium faecavium]|nr:cadmium-translocating P-type ATPase [Candidatus Eubacterium faecavium]
MGVGIALFIAGYLVNELTQLPFYVPLILFAASYLIVGFNILKEAVEGIFHGNIFNENFLMAIASIGAFILGEYSEGCAVVILYSIGEFLQDLAVGKSRKSITDMIRSAPQKVHVERDGKLMDEDPEKIKQGELFVVNPGEKVELDGVIESGSAEVDMAALTGESIPVSLGAGDDILSGSINVDGMLKVRASKAYKDSTVARILDMIEDADAKKSHAEKFITRFARIYTPIVCLVALLIIVVPPLFFGGEWKDWAYRGLSALVVSCPCAIVISIPLGFFSGLGASSKQGVLIKGSNYLEMLSKFDVAVFDKTGTITSGKFEYVNCECVNCHCEDKKEHRELLGIIAACEKYSTHPIAKSVSLAFGQFADGLEVTDAKNYAGMGVSAVVNGKRYYAGNEKLMKKVGVAFKETKLVGTAIYLCSDEEFLGDIVFADVIKTDSKEAVSELYALGVKKTVMLTGDKPDIAADIAGKAGINEYYSKLLPNEKVDKVREIKEKGAQTVLYTGDGINDAPVLAQADIGVAMGGIGSDVAIEAADVVIMGDSLSKIPVARRIAKKTMTIVHENIIFSIAVKVLIIIGSALGIFGESAMWLAVFGDVGVCLIAVANALRALRYKEKKKKKKEHC